MERQIIISYNWWHSTKKKVPNEHWEQLETDAMDRVEEMRKEGYSSGELHSVVVQGKKEIEYQGHWEIKTKTL